MHNRAILFFLLCPFLVLAQQPDRFADIGNKVSSVRSNLLETKEPRLLPNIQLPFKSGGKQRFEPMNRLDTQEELQIELQKYRTKFSSFLKNYAPPGRESRISIALNQFNWRIENDSDKKDFLSVVNGKGSWEKVVIPHYGPPLGKACTYYQTDFVVSDSMLKRGAIFIAFKAVDYKANVFINGAYIGSHEGAFAPFEFDISSNVTKGKNSLLIKVENDYPMTGHVGDDGKKLDGDKVYAATGLGYDDPVLGWHHCPPGMGIWQDVSVVARATLHINDIFIRPIGNSDTAEVWVEVNNTEANYKSIKLRHSLYGRNFQQTIYENKMYVPSTVQIPGVGDLAKPTDWEQKELKMGKGVNYLKFTIGIPKAKHWSPEEPWLYELKIELLNEENSVTDIRQQHFGMRSFRMDTVSIPKGAMYLNNEFIRLRGANTMGAFMQSVKKKDWQQLTDDILLAKICNLNYIRMTQFPAQPEVYDYCDMLGMMTQTDLPLFGELRRNKWAECIRQAEEMERLVRSHPCNIMVTYINERFPNAEGAPQRHFDQYADFEKFFLAADQAVLLNNPDRVIKAGDGDYDPPSPGLPDNHVYNGWYNGHGLGLGEMHKGYWVPVKPEWYYACGEFGSEGLDFYNTMQRYYPKAWLPTNAAEEKGWTPNGIAMSQTYRFHYLWYNRQSTVQDWINESQKHQAWVTRFTTEAFRRNNDMVSFAIHLFIDAWPAGWMKSIMDVNRQAKKAYFEYAHALQPLAVSLRTDRYQFFSGEKITVEAWIANDKKEVPDGALLRYQFEQNGKLLGTGNAPATIISNKSKFQGFITINAPLVTTRTTITLRLQLVTDKGLPLHETDVALEIFPSSKAVNKKAWIAGNTRGLAASLVAELGMTVTTNAADADVLLIDSLSIYQAQKNNIDQLVSEGKTAVFLQPPVGNFVVANDSIHVNKTIMGQYYFVSPSLQHPLMKLFQPNDFRLWFNSNKNLISPILSEMSQMNGWTSLLTTGQTGWVGSSDYAYAAAEKKWGKGMFRINHVQLNGRIKANPAAREFALLLLGK